MAVFPLEVKLVGKYSLKTCQNKLSLPLFNSLKFSLRAENEWAAWLLSNNLWHYKSCKRKPDSKDVCFNVIFQEQCTGGPFIKWREEIPPFQFS